MFIDKDSLQVKINGGNYISLGQYILEAKYGYNKLWVDGGRNLAGSMTGTLVGIFPKIIVQFGRLNKSEMEIITPILDNASQTLRYYDPNKKAYVEMETYTGDYEYLNKSTINNDKKNDGFSVSFIAIRRRS